MAPHADSLCNKPIAATEPLFQELVTAEWRSTPARQCAYRRRRKNEARCDGTMLTCHVCMMTNKMRLSDKIEPRAVSKRRSMQQAASAVSRRLQRGSIARPAICSASRKEKWARHMVKKSGRSSSLYRAAYALEGQMPHERRSPAG